MPEAVPYGNAGCVVHGPSGGPDEGDRPVFGASGGRETPRGRGARRGCGRSRRFSAPVTQRSVIRLTRP